MPAVAVVFYRGRQGDVPVRDWLLRAAQRDVRTAAKIRVWLEQLAEQGHALRRQAADYLRDDIHDLRIRYGSVNYRILYFFHGRSAVVLVNAWSRSAKRLIRISTSRLPASWHSRRIPRGTQPQWRGKMKRKTTDALAIIDRAFDRQEGYEEAVAEERVKAQAAREIYESRKAAGLTQKQLADLIGTHQSVIARLEAADYEGHTIAMLDRIATALGKRLVVRFVA